MTYEHFTKTRDELGRPAEYLSVAMWKAYGLEAEINSAPEEDYDGRAAYDIWVAGRWHEVKTDLWTRRSRRIFVERASLEHSKADYFEYWMTTPYGFDVRLFTRQQLIAYYNAISEVHRPDGSIYQVYVYEHANKGEQEDNHGVFVPLEVVKAEGIAPWQYVKNITNHNRNA